MYSSKNSQSAKRLYTTKLVFKSHYKIKMIRLKVNNKLFISTPLVST